MWQEITNIFGETVCSLESSDRANIEGFHYSPNSVVAEDSASNRHPTPTPRKSRSTPHPRNASSVPVPVRRGGDKEASGQLSNTVALKTVR